MDECDLFMAKIIFDIHRLKIVVKLKKIALSSLHPIHPLDREDTLKATKKRASPKRKAAGKKAAATRKRKTAVRRKAGKKAAATKKRKTSAKKGKKKVKKYRFLSFFMYTL